MAQNENELLVERFYTAFQNKDAAGMQACYADDVVFTDPAFGMLHGDNAKQMWGMLLERGKDLKIDFSDIKDNGKTITASWQAQYAYGPKKRKVDNQIKARFWVLNGKIIRHVDRFDLWKWSRQALGPMGFVLGWSGYFKQKLQSKTRAMLKKYMTQKA
jgi:ketosteroid isomerase-like protein